MVFLLAMVPIFLIASYVNIFIGIALAVVVGFLIFAVFSATQTIFISSVYHNITGKIDDHFDRKLIDSLCKN
ncbi:MAG: hypothetical protein IPL50_10395 [Chitinophagaceae bacterium]|nr:hypothetical protein [Chitinophagaceae bacterium]